MKLIRLKLMIFHLHLLQSIFLTTRHQNQKIAIIDIAAGPELASVNCSAYFPRVDTSRDNGYPNSSEVQHAEGDKLGLIEVIW